MAGACGAVRTTVSPRYSARDGRGLVSVIWLVAAAALRRTVVFPVTLNCGSTSIRSQGCAALPG